MSDSPTFRSPNAEAEVPQNSFDPDADWGPAGCDIRHRFVGSVIYKVPYSATGGVTTGEKIARGILGGWQASLIYQWQSGFPFTVSVFGDTANAGSLLNVNPIRANVVPGVSPDVDDPNADMWFNTAAFTTPPPFTFGTATRNCLWGPGLKKGGSGRRPRGAGEHGVEAAFPVRDLQPVQYSQLQHAEPVREHAAVRHDHGSGHVGQADSVRDPRHVLIL